MDYINKMQLTIPALSLNESFARGVVGAFCVSINPTLEQINDLKTAVSEAVTNCVVHGYKNQQGDITIDATLFADRQCNRFLQPSQTKKGQAWALPLCRLLWTKLF